MNTQVVFVTALHGNEVLPTLALASAGVPQILGNPQAVREGVRFLEKDLNASFATSGESREEQRARVLLREIPQEARVIDFHTTTGKTPPFAIVVDLDQVEFAHQLGFTRIVHMKHNIKAGHALINHRKGISAELGSHNDPKVFDYTREIAEKAQKLEPNPQPYQLYEVYDTINETGNYTNFSLFCHGEESFYPVLSGEKSYKIFGLKARVINRDKGTL